MYLKCESFETAVGGVIIAMIFVMGCLECKSEVSAAIDVQGEVAIDDGADAPSRMIPVSAKGATQEV